MNDILHQLPEKGFNRVLIIGSVLNYRRSLATSLIKLLNKPVFSALDPTEGGLPDVDYDWSSLDMVFIDLSEYKAQIRPWYFEIAQQEKLPPVIFLDNHASVDDAGDMIRAGAADYIDITSLDTRRLFRALLIADSMCERGPQEDDAEVPDEPEGDMAATQVMRDVDPQIMSSFPQIQGMTDEPTEVLPALTPAMLKAFKETQDVGKKIEEELSDASFLTEDMLAILARVPESAEVESTEVTQEVAALEKSDDHEEISDASFLTTGLMSILEKDNIQTGKNLPKKQSVHADAFTVGKRWPFTQEELDQGKASLGDYQLLEFVAVGGTASVFRAQYVYGDEILAIKLFDSEIGAETSHERCLRGYRLIKEVSHPNLVSIKEFAFSGDYAFVVMEYISGGDLKSHIEKGISRQQAVQYTAQLANALNAAHDKDIVHRDLKPSNILIREDGTLALLDFGIATLMTDSHNHLTKEGFVVGTSHYICPEHAVGGRLDARSDLYSLGIILYEMLEGKRPYTGKSPTEIMQQHVYGPVPVLSSVHDPLNAVISRMCAKNPDDRFSSGAEVVDALSRAIPKLMGEYFLTRVN